MENNNVVPFKRKKSPKKTKKNFVVDDFEKLVSDVRKRKLKAFVALVWIDDDIVPYESYSSPIDSHAILGALETYKIQSIMRFYDE